MSSTEANTGSTNRYLTFTANDSHNPYGFQYFDKSLDINEEEEEEEEFDMKSCASNCCDDDCECDDCARCSKTGLLGPESFISNASAA